MGQPGMPFRRHHVPPPPGEDQPLHGKRQGGGGAGLVTVNNRLFAPLQSLDPSNILQGGYGWLDKTDGGATFHPGLDLNAGGRAIRTGLAVVVRAGVVRAVLWWNGSTPGEGNHVWVELDDPCCPGPTWWHTDHLQSVAAVVGQRLTPGQPIGTCGRTGGWDCAHAHSELLTNPPQDGWWQWPYGWSRQQVEASWNPHQWYRRPPPAVAACEGQFARGGGDHDDRLRQLISAVAPYGSMKTGAPGRPVQSHQRASSGALRARRFFTQGGPRTPGTGSSERPGEAVGEFESGGYHPIRRTARCPGRDDLG
jgi:hypothetical protein